MLNFFTLSSRFCFRLEFLFQHSLIFPSITTVFSLFQLCIGSKVSFFSLILGTICLQLFFAGNNLKHFKLLEYLSTVKYYEFYKIRGGTGTGFGMNQIAHLIVSSLTSTLFLISLHTQSKEKYC